MAEPAAIETRGLGKVYGPGALGRLLGRPGHRALEDVTVSLPTGAVVGVLGPNGAGKTTFLKCLVGLLDPTEGQAQVLGLPVSGADPAVRARVGVLIGRPALYGYLSGRRNLELRAALYPGAAARVEELLGEVGLADAADAAASRYSTGMKQRLGLAGALLADPEVLILDEPTSGLDPAGRRDVRELVRRCAAEAGRTVLVSSHLLGEVEAMCDHLVILDRGRLRAAGPKEELLRGGALRLRLRVDAPERAAALLAELPGVDTVGAPDVEGGVLELSGAAGVAPEVARALCEAGLALHELTPRPHTLEELFLAETGGASRPAAPPPGSEEGAGC